MGAFKSSPVASLQCEASIPPLSLRRKQFIVNNYSKIINNPSHPLHEIFKTYPLLNLFFLKPNHPKPFVVRAKSVITDTIKTEPSFPPIIPLKKPPWLIPIIHLNTYLLRNFHKSTTTIDEYKIEFSKLLRKYNEYDFFYTDGSKSKNGTGSAIYNENVSHSFRLNNKSSVVTTELYAIFECLKHIQNNSTTNKFCICSDSSSSLLMIEPTSSNYIVRNIINLLISTEFIHKRIVFIWVPAHVNIHGNECVDKLAKAATILPTIAFNHLLYSDYRILVKEQLFTEWATTWSNITPQQNKLRLIKSNVRKWNYNNNKRRDSVVLTRIRIGHTLLTHEFLMTKTDPPMCNTCGNTQLTIRHIIEDCIQFADDRRRNGVISIQQAAGDDINGNASIINFLKDIDLYDKI